MGYDQEQLKILAGEILDLSIETIELIQPRISDCNIIYNYLKDDTETMLRYGAAIGQLFGGVNSLTKMVDILTINLNDVIDGLYDSYPDQALASMLMIWDEQMYSSLADVDNHVSQIEDYIKIFESPEMDIENFINKKATIH